MTSRTQQIAPGSFDARRDAQPGRDEIFTHKPQESCELSVVVSDLAGILRVHADGLNVMAGLQRTAPDYRSRKTPHLRNARRSFVRTTFGVPNTLTLSCAAHSMPTPRRHASRRDKRRRGRSELRLA